MFYRPIIVIIMPLAYSSSTKRGMSSAVQVCLLLWSGSTVGIKRCMQPYRIFSSKLNFHCSTVSIYLSIFCKKKPYLTLQSAPKLPATGTRRQSWWWWYATKRNEGVDKAMAMTKVVSSSWDAANIITPLMNITSLLFFILFISSFYVK